MKTRPMGGGALGCAVFILAVVIGDVAAAAPRGASINVAPRERGGSITYNLHGSTPGR